MSDDRVGQNCEFCFLCLSKLPAGAHGSKSCHAQHLLCWTTVTVQLPLRRHFMKQCLVVQDQENGAGEAEGSCW